MLLRPLNLRVIDFETSNLPAKGGKIIEIGWLDLEVTRETTGEISLSDSSNLSSARYGLPQGEEIDLFAQAVNHIRKEDLPSWYVLDSLSLSSYLQCEAGTTRQFDYLIAHNASFEEAMFKNYGIEQGGEIFPLPPLICTMKVAKRVFPSQKSFALQYLRYALDLEGGKRDLRCDPPHSAGADVWLTFLLFKKMLEEFHVTIDEMVGFSSRPTLHLTCPIGKYKGAAWNEVETGYLKWILKSPTIDADVKAAAKDELIFRGQA
jgi:exodeoxyribonuclease X